MKRGNVRPRRGLTVLTTLGLGALVAGTLVATSMVAQRVATSRAPLGELAVARPEAVADAPVVLRVARRSGAIPGGLGASTLDVGAPVPSEVTGLPDVEITGLDLAPSLPAASTDVLAELEDLGAASLTEQSARTARRTFNAQIDFVEHGDDDDGDDYERDDYGRRDKKGPDVERRDDAKENDKGPGKDRNRESLQAEKRDDEGRKDDKGRKDDEDRDDHEGGDDDEGSEGDEKKGQDKSSGKEDSGKSSDKEND